MLVIALLGGCGPEPVAPLEDVTLPFPCDLLTVEDSEGSRPAASAAVREQAASFLDGALGSGGRIIDPYASSR